MAVSNDSSLKSSGQDVTLGELVSQMWLNRKWILIATAIVTAIAVVIAFLLTPIYTTSVTMLPQNSSANNGVFDKLASFTNMPMTNESSYESFYGEILHSDRLLNQVIARKWQTISNEEKINLHLSFKIAEGPGDSEPTADQDFLLKEYLRSRVIFFKQDMDSGFMVLNVSVPKDAVLAADLANFLVSKLDELIRDIRSGKASEQRTFVAGRLDFVEKELKDSEKAQTNFVKSNRAYLSSPDLTQRYGELEREVQAHTSVWVELRRQLELARIEEKKESVSIDILDQAYPPMRRSSPNRPVIVLSGALFGFLLGCLLSLFLGRTSKR